MMRRNTARLLFAAYASGSATLLAPELISFDRNQRQSFGYEQVSSKGRIQPLSLRGTHDVLSVCDSWLSVPNSHLKAHKSLTADADYCARSAARVLTKMPTHGYANLVAAQAAHFHDDFGLRDVHLTRSQAVSPFEGWLSERRFSLLTGGPRGSTQTELMRAEIGTLLSTQSGAERLALYAKSDAGLKALIDQKITVSAFEYRQRMANLYHRQGVPVD